MALMTAAEVRTYLPGLTGTGEDTVLDTLITRAEHALAAFCRWPAASSTAAPKLEQQTYTLYLDGPDDPDDPELSRELSLMLRPIISVTSIHDDPDRGYGSSYLVSSDSYEIDKRGGRILLLPSASHEWSVARRAIKVVAVCGLTTGSIPEAVKEAVAWTVKAALRQRASEGRTSLTQGGQSQAFEPPMLVPLLARQAIAPWVIAERDMSGAPEVAVG